MRKEGIEWRMILVFGNALWSASEIRCRFMPVPPPKAEDGSGRKHPAESEPNFKETETASFTANPSDG